MPELKPVWKQVVERKHPPLFMDFLLRGQDKSVFERATGISFSLTNIRKVKLGLYVDSSEMQALMRIFNDCYNQRGASFFCEYAKRCYMACRELLDTAESIGAKKHSNLSKGELIEDLRLYDQRVLDVAAFLESIIAAQWVLEKLFDETLTLHLSTRNLSDQKDRLKTSLSIPQEDNFIVQSIRDLNQIEAQIQESEELRDFFQQPTQLIINSLDQVPEIAQAINSHVSRFGWMKPLYYSGQPATSTDIVERIQRALQTNCKEKLAISAKEQQEASDRFADSMRLVGDNQPLAELISIIREFLHLRTYRLDVFFIANNSMLGFLNEVAKRIGVDYEGLLFLTVEEIENALLGQNLSASGISCERQEGFAVSMENGSIRWYSGQPLDSYLKLEWEEAPKANELRGIVASPGRAVGSAKILLDNADMKKMLDGDILVTTMTTPNFMEAIEKAAGIVTSEGGMLCHAAIVSRELGLPCVIGTERATEVFSDGDSLEVIADGSEGVVRKT